MGWVYIYGQPTFWLELRHGYITTLGIFIELPQVKLSLEFVHESHREVAIETKCSEQVIYSVLPASSGCNEGKGVEEGVGYRQARLHTREEKGKEAKRSSRLSERKNNRRVAVVKVK